MKSITTLLVCVAFLSGVKAADYYVSSAGNDDANAGTSSGAPWQTLGKVNGISFSAGDRIFFRGGDTFPGTLTPKTSGTAGNPILFSSYGSGRATINAGNWAAISCNQSFVTIDNLNAIGNGRKAGNTQDGLDFHFCSNNTISNMDVSGFLKSGIFLYTVTNATVVHVNAHDNGFGGISPYVGSNIYIGYCNTDNNPGCPTVTDRWSGSGIVLGSVTGATVEYCEASNNGWDMQNHGGGPIGIWAYESSNVTIQYCIAHDNKTGPYGGDGGGFDLDGGVTNSTVQYCLSYNNQGVGYGMFEYPGASAWSNNTIRYCISQNDGTRDGHAAMFFWNGGGTFQNANVYNNVFIQNNGNIVGYTDPSSYCPGSIFANNIFISNGSYFTIWNNQMSYSSVTLRGNCYWNMSGGFSQDGYSDLNSWANATGQEKINGAVVGICADPKLADPYTAITLTDPSLLPTLPAFKLLAGSSCIDKGVNVQSLFGINPGTRDFFGDAIPQGNGFDIGAYEALPSPTIGSLSPQSGSLSGGIKVTITGTSLAGTSSVTFGGIAATSVAVLNATSVTCVTPAHTAGAVDVVLNAPTGSITSTGFYTYVNAAPTVATAASAAPSPVTGTTTALSVLGADDGGEAALTYTWSTTGTPPAAVNFSVNGTNAAKNTTTTFTKSGSYSFQVAIKDSGNLTATGSVNVTVNQTLTSIVVSPSIATLVVSATQQCSATARDQFTTNLTTQPNFTWTVDTGGAGSVNATGLYSAGATAGSATVRAISGTASGTSSVTINNAGIAIANGAYVIVCQTSGLALDNPNGSGTGADQQAYNGVNQQWILTAVGGGEYEIASAANGLALSGPTASSQLVFQPYTGASAQLWSFKVNGSYYNLVNASTGQLMDDFSVSTLPSNPVGQWAANGGSNQNWSLIPIPPPQAPANLTATAGNAQVGLAWTASMGAVGYNIYRGSAAGGESATTIAANIKTTSYTDTGLSNGTTYYYKVAAINVAGVSGMSNEASAAATAPFLSSITVSPNSVNVPVNSTQQFTATAKDQYGNPLAAQPTFNWSANGGGTFSTGALANGGIEAGMSPWFTYGNANVAASNAHSGSYSQTIGANSGFFQQLNGLTPGATYILTGWSRVQVAGDTVWIGVKSYGGPERATAISSTSYKQGAVSFTMPSGNSSAMIYIWMSSATGLAYGDDFELETNGLFKAGSTPGGPFVITASSGGVSGSTNVASRDAGGASGDYQKGTASVVIAPAPLAIGSVFANPNPASVGETLQFAVTVVNPDSSLTYAWDFGDGSSGIGATAAHTYDAVGIYTAKAVVTDAQGETQSGTVQIEIDPPSATKSELKLQKFAATLNFASAQRDAMTMSAWLQLPAEFNLAQPVAITIGASQFRTTLNKKGFGKLTKGIVKISSTRNGLSRLSINLQSASLEECLGLFGATNTDSLSVPIAGSIEVDIGTTQWIGTFQKRYSARAGKAGKIY